MEYDRLNYLEIWHNDRLIAKRQIQKWMTKEWLDKELKPVNLKIDDCRLVVDASGLRIDIESFDSIRLGNK